MEVNRFTDKLNKIDGKTYVVEEKAVLENGVYEAELRHDNINENTLSVYTGSKLTGIRIETYSLSTPSLAPWKRIIRIYADVPEVYISYETDGDTVEADDINLVQKAITATQEALNAEDNRAKSAENGLAEDIASEVARAKAVEEKLTGDIRGEVVRAEGKEVEISARLNNEIIRASQEEEKIKSSIDANKPIWDDKYTRNEVDNKFSMMETNIDWKEAVDTYDDIATAYPNPEDGWTVNVKDTDYTYRYNGSEWVAISANAIPKATDSIDGLLSKEDRAKYESAFTHISDTAKHIKADERTAWNAAKNHADSAHAPIDAQVNVIETIKVNGTALTPSEKEVDIDIPTYASDSIAGIVKPKEIYVNQTDGTLELTRRTTDSTLYDSYAGGIKINEIQGKSEQFSGTITDESGSDVTVPNPNYPQEIKSVEIGEIKTTTAQLFDSTKAQDNKYQNSSIDSGNFKISQNENFWITGLIQVKPNTQYACSHRVGRGAFYSDENTPIKTTTVEANVATFTTPEGCHFVNLNFAKSLYPFGTAVMLNEGDITLPWQPYQSSFITLSSNITLNGIGDVKDRIVKKGGVWGVERKVNVYKFDSEYKADSFVFLAPSIPNKYVMHYTNQTDEVVVSNAGTSPNMISNYFKPIGQAIGDSNDIVGVTYVNSAYRFYLGLDSSINSAEDFANWINEMNAVGNPLTVMALKKSSIFEPLPTADQIALNSLESFDTVTYLDTDSELQPSWDVEYGTSRVGGYAIEALNMARINAVRISELTAATLMLNQE